MLIVLLELYNVIVCMQTSEEVTRLRGQLKATPTSASLVRRLEGERDDARMEARQLRSECDSLQTRLKVQCCKLQA